MIKVIPLKYYDGGFMTRAFAFGGTRDKEKCEDIKYGSSLQNFLIDDGKEVILSDTGIQLEGKKGLDYNSVIVFGRIKPVNNMEKTIDICRKLSAQFDFGEEYIEEEIQKFAKFVLCLELSPEHICGKCVNES